jgi:mannan endo-1,4-beta-mannosidase
MKSRLVMILALVLAATSVAATGSRLASSSPTPPPAHAALTPKPASYLGVFEPGAPPTYSSIAGFAKAAGRQPNLLGTYSGWAEPFDTSFARMIRSHGIIPFVQIDPTDASVAAIADGTYDSYLRSYAASVRDFRTAVVIGFGHEMNARWYSWGYGHVPPATFVAAWRHIVTLFRDQGAGNVTWLWTIQADQARTGPIASWWPGSRYVTWVGIDGYYERSSDTFNSIFAKTIAQVRTFADEPILLSETAVGSAVDQLAKILDLFHGMAADKTLGLVWFDEDQYRAHGGISDQDWRLEDSLPAEVSFRLGVRDDLAPSLPGG